MEAYPYSSGSAQASSHILDQTMEEHPSLFAEDSFKTKKRCFYGATTFGITTLSITTQHNNDKRDTQHYDIEHDDIQRNDTRNCYAECRKQYHCAECHYAESYNAEFRYAKCRYAERRGFYITTLTIYQPLSKSQGMAKFKHLAAGL